MSQREKLLYLIFSAYITLICQYNARLIRVVGFISIICINANTSISSIPFKCTSLGTATRHPAANPSNLLYGHSYCLLSTRCFYTVVANGFYINV